MKIDKFDLKEAKLNAEKIKMEQCEICRGTGIDPATTPVMGVICPKCKGSGKKVQTTGYIQLLENVAEQIQDSSGTLKEIEVTLNADEILKNLEPTIEKIAEEAESTVRILEPKTIPAYVATKEFSAEESKEINESFKSDKEQIDKQIKKVIEKNKKNSEVEKSDEL